MTGIREQLIKIHRQNYLRNVNLMKKTLEENPEIKLYEQEYWKYLKNFQQISSKRELIAKVCSSDVIYHGDYHTLKQSQRSVLRILREITDKRSVILCLEMFHVSDQKFLDKFLRGLINEKPFLSKIKYHAKWPFSWNHWKPIIDLCRENKIPIHGINSTVSGNKGRLLTRDIASAKIIARLLIQYPKHLIYVVDGEYHVSPPHLPFRVNNLLGHFDIHVKQLTIYQNAENLYWKLCKNRQEEADVLKIDNQSFCIMNTMPANKVRSYLNWLAYSEDAYFPVHEEWDEQFSEDTAFSITGMVETIASVFEIPIPNKAFSRLKIYYSSNLHFLEELLKTPAFKTHSLQIRQKMGSEEAFLLEYLIENQSSYIIYLPNSNLNMAAEEATHFLNAICRGVVLDKEKNPMGNFYRRVLTECVGFVGSKVINEKRKALSENACRVFLGCVRDSQQDEDVKLKAGVARFVLQHLYLQRRSGTIEDYKKKFGRIYQEDPIMANMYSTQLGYILGNRLYYALKRGRVPKEYVSQLFQKSFQTIEEAWGEYHQLSERVKK